MFRNSPEVDGGGTAYLGPTTIIEMTIPMSQSSSDAALDDSWVLAGPISCPPIRGVVHSSDGRRNVRSFVFLFARMHVLWLDVARYSLALGTLFCIYVLWRRGTRGSHVFGSDWAGGLISGGNFSVSRIFQGKKEVP